MVPNRGWRTGDFLPVVPKVRTLFAALLLLVSLATHLPAQTGQAGGASAQLPEASEPVPPAKPEPCRTKRDGQGLAEGATAGTVAVNPAQPALNPSLAPGPCAPLEPLIDWYARFLSGPKVKPMTPKEKAWLAVRNLMDPFNVLTIVGEAGISVAANSHSAYGPGFPGWGRYVGVSYTEDMTGEFFGTFLIPSIARQDPHYHRMPVASIPRRALHTVIQVVWTEGDNGQSMLNYADLVGFACDDAVSNLYVPGQQTRFSASTERYFTALGTAPIDNVITEFLPDVARHIHVRIVLVQNIINQVARTDGSAP